MKKLFIFLLTAFCTLSTFAQDDSLFKEQIVESRCGADSMWFPEGSLTAAQDDGTIDIQVPDGWVYIGRDIAGNVHQAQSASSCSCTCTGGGGGTCLPTISGGNCSCSVSEGCTSCRLTTSGGGDEPPFILGGNDDAPTKSALDGLRVVPEVNDGGYINLNAGVSLDPGNTKRPPVFEMMYELPEINEAMEAFLDRIYPDGYRPEAIENNGTLEPPYGYQFAKINVFGRSAAVLIPSDGMAAPTKAASSGNKPCTCVEGECRIKIFNWPGTYSCVGMCYSTCTLSL